MQQQQANYQTAAGAISQMAPVTVVHFVLIALFAVAAVAIIIFGARLARRRHRAEDEAAAHQQEVADATSSAAPPVTATPAAPLETSAPAAASGGDLTRLKGLGPRIATRLGELGVNSIADMTRLTPDAAAAIDADLGPFAGRLSSDRWVEQAKLLAAGDIEGYERAFGKLG